MSSRLALVLLEESQSNWRRNLMLNQCWPAQYLVLSRKQLGANFTYLNPKILWKRSDSACGQPPWFMSQRLMAPCGRVETMLLLSTPDSTFLSIQFPCLCLCQAARVKMIQQVWFNECSSETLIGTWQSALCNHQYTLWSVLEQKATFWYCIIPSNFSGPWTSFFKVLSMLQSFYMTFWSWDRMMNGTFRIWNLFSVA